MPDQRDWILIVIGLFVVYAIGSFFFERGNNEDD